MRAVADCSPYEKGFFIVLDRLYSTLADRMKLWKKRHQGSLKSLSFGKPKNKVDPVLIEKIIVAYQIGRAMAYFHQMNIIYRDLKPQNIGFDVRGDVKIFDLGFAKEVPIDEKLPDGTFKLTGKVGSLFFQ
jgi:tRNA A-37 threonylcarbamoyl transferase component Bud32